MMNPSDYELGDEPVDVQLRPWSGVRVSVHLAADEADRLLQLAEERRSNLPQVVHDAITAYLQALPSVARASSG
ncbi:MAG: ribbon-helix-helix domain-containing protein [Dehalococcoidia bacterium]